MYADDATFTLSAKDPVVLEQRMNWYESNTIMAFCQQSNSECQKN